MVSKRKYLAGIAAGVAAMLLLYGCPQQDRPAEGAGQEIREQIKNERLIQ